MAARVALGGTRARLLLESLGESSGLALVGLSGGLVLARAGGPVLLHFLPVGKGPLPISLRPRPGVMAIASAIVAAVSLLFGTGCGMAWSPTECFHGIA